MIYYQDLEIDKLNFKKSYKFDNRLKQVITYYNIECGFDIETSSIIDSEGEKQAFMYLWGFGIGDKLVYGRNWFEFLDLCNKLKEHLELSSTNILICYVHNLGYEFQFMRKYFEWENVFSIDERKPIKALSNFGIEFRCSYILSGFNLNVLSKNLVKHKIKKLIGDLDYRLIRHEKTIITDEEMNYLKNDVLIILYYINEQIEQYDNNITKIPLTNTGRVRTFVRNKCYYTDKSHKKSSRGKYSRYRELMEELTLTDDEYTMLKRCFMGGFTHASSLYSGKLLENVSSIDFTSSYPSVMLAEKYPMSKPIKVDLKKEDFKTLLNNDDTGLMFDVRFTNLHSKLTYETYISESKCLVLEGGVINNGRVFKADKLVTTITNIDFKIIQACYSWDSIEISNCYKFYMQYLPNAILQSILELYEKKTVLKDVEGYEVEYLLSKGMLNSVYGMCVTDIVRDEILYNDDWLKNVATEEDVFNQIEIYNNSKTRFLYYPWGVWVTAYARKNLWNGILNIGEDYVYSDTDSIKFLNYEKHIPYIKWYNSDLEKKLKKMCDFRKIDFELMKPKTKEGIVKMMGVWDFEGTYTHFKTLGAKRYMQREQDGKMKITVAGLSKQNGMEYLNRITNNDYLKIFDSFNDELYIPSNETGKMTHTYIDTKFKGVVKDYKGVECDILSLSSIHLEPCDFTLSISKQYMDFLKKLKEGYLYTGIKTI